MNARACALLAAASVLLAGCTSSGSPAATTTGSAGTSAVTGGATSPTGEATSRTGGAASAGQLATRLGAALDALNSAHLDIDAGALGGKSTVDVALTDGRASATEVHLTKNGQQLEEITVDGTTYAKIPAAANSTGKPWVVVSSSSGNAIARALASGFDIAGVTSSLDVVTRLVASSDGLQDKGGAQVGGVDTTHYTMQLDPTRKTGNAELDGLLALLGKSRIPVDLWLDSKDRPVKFTIHVSLGGTAFPVTVQVSGFDEPVTIKAPPAAQVSRQ